MELFINVLPDEGRWIIETPMVYKEGIEYETMEYRSTREDAIKEARFCRKNTKLRIRVYNTTNSDITYIPKISKNSI